MAEKRETIGDVLEALRQARGYATLQELSYDTEVNTSTLYHHRNKTITTMTARTIAGIVFPLALDKRWIERFAKAAGVPVGRVMNYQDQFTPNASRSTDTIINAKILELLNRIEERRREELKDLQELRKLLFPTK